MIELIVALVIVGVLLYIVTLIPMDATIKKIITVVVILLVVLWILQAFGIIGGGPLFPKRLGR
jgi:hypothetical protein